MEMDKDKDKDKHKDKFCISGGHFRNSVFTRLEEWECCNQALLVEIDPATRTSRKIVEYVSPNEVSPDELPSFLFKYASAHGNKLYTCTATEVIIYDLPSLRVAHYISLPIFNDLHHVTPSTRRDTLLVAVTGLDIVAEVSYDGKLLRQWDVMGADTWSLYSKDVDYRKVSTTKPHRAHANFVFELGDELWVTRSHQREAISLDDPTRRIEIAIQRPHEGYLYNGFLYFTTVDGHIVIVNPKSLKIEHIHDLSKMSGAEESLGFCRGLLLLDERFAWVGFTRIRPTKFRENLSWVRHPTRPHRHSHVSLYDLQKGVCLDDIETEPHGVGVVSNVFKI
jgi:hypothetical protein